MRRDMLVTVWILGFIIGVTFHSFIDFGVSFALLWLVLGLSFLCKQTHATFCITAVILLGLGCGLLRYDLAPLPATTLPVGEQVVLVGIVIEEPQEKEGTQRLVLQLQDENRVLVSTAATPAYRYGDELELVGQLLKPKNLKAVRKQEALLPNASGSKASGPSLRTEVEADRPAFDWVGYLAKDGITYQMFRPSVRVLAHDKGKFITARLLELKGAFTANIERVISEPASALLGGLVLGAKTTLGPELTEQFRRTGVSHIVALSGYNMTIVADTIVKVFSFLPRLASNWLGVAGILLFSIMAGAGATVVRAAIMALIVIFARARGNTYNMGRALIFAGVLMVLHNPRILVFDVSFQLSFLATLGILYGPPIIEPYFRWLTRKFQFRSTAVTTTSAQLAVLPLILYKMGNLSIVALPVNMLILPLIPATMLWGFLTGIVGFLGTVISLPFAYVSYLLLAYELVVVRLFSSLPFAAVEFYIPLWLMLSLYVGMTALVYKLGKGTQTSGDKSVAEGG